MLKRFLLIAALIFPASAYGETPGFSETPAADWPMTPEEIGKSEKVNRWTRECLDQCGINDPCAKICGETLAQWVMCAKGDRFSCDKRDRSLAEIKRYAAQKKKAATETQAGDWYPKATDSCATLLTQIPRFGGSKPLNRATLWHDPSMRKFVSEFNAAQRIEDSTGVYALIGLINYCNSHGLTKLGDVKVDDVRKESVSEPLRNLSKELGVDVSAGAPSPSPSNPEQRELADQWARWLKQSLDFCGADERCKEIANRTFANHLRCDTGDRLACDERARDLADIERYNAQRRKPAPQAPPQSALMQCLQSSAETVAKWCRETNCNTDSLVDIIGVHQKTLCGYSAIGSSTSRQYQAPPVTDFACVDAMLAGRSGLTIGMAMQVCTR